MSLPVTSSKQPSQATEKSAVNEHTVTLQPLAMCIPNPYGIYSPSKLQPQKTISYKEFLAQYADHPKQIKVCFDECVSGEGLLAGSQMITAYGFGLDCWYSIKIEG